MAVPVPLDPAAGDKLTAVGFDIGVRDPLLWLLGTYPRVRAFDASGTSCASGVETLIGFDGETYDTAAMHSPTVNPSRIVLPETGTYEIRVAVQWLANATAFTANTIHVRRNSTGTVGSGSTIRNFQFGVSGRLTQITFCRVFTAAEWIEVYVSQTMSTPATLSTTSGEYMTYVEVRMIATT